MKLSNEKKIKSLDFDFFNAIKKSNQNEKN